MCRCVKTLKQKNGGAVVKLITLQDVSDRVKAEEKLKYLSTHDSLTGLFNRNFFEAEMQRLQSGRSFPISILVTDLDKLKEINDRYGHEAGDLLLKEVAKVFRETFRADDITARLGGDEFVFLLLKTDESVRNCIERSWAKSSNPWQEILPIPFASPSAVDCGMVVCHRTLKKADDPVYADKRKNKSLKHNLCVS